MSVELDEKLVGQIVSQAKTQDDLADLSRQRLKATVELKTIWNIPSTLRKAVTQATAGTVITRRQSKAISERQPFKHPEIAMVNSHPN